MPFNDVEIWEKCDECCCSPSSRPLQRTVLINRKPTIASLCENERYPKNRVVTSRYTWWSFLPKNLLEQFLRLSNIYFLVTAIIQLANPDTPLPGSSSLTPLITVLFLTALKQGYEDIRRHRDDRKINHRLIPLVIDGHTEMVRSDSLQVGDIIRVAKNEPFPCDLVLLSSALPTGECYVTTASLDGESNLKTYRSVRETKSLTNAESLSAIRGVIECEQPTTQLYKFSGRVLLDRRTVGDCLESLSDVAAQPYAVKTQPTTKNGAVNAAFEFGGADAVTNAKICEDVRSNEDPQMKSQQEAVISNVCATSLDERNLLLRGARLRNTEFVYGCVLYTGPETKLALNSRRKRTKLSCAQKRLSLLQLINVVCFLVITLLSTGLTYYYRFLPVISGAWYLLPLAPTATAGDILIQWLNYYVLFTYLVPIALLVTLEMQRFAAYRFFEWDEQMYEPTRGERAKANTSDLNEDLGQVQFLFSDKTGTLTENEMIFRECSVNGVQYVDQEGSLFMRLADETSPDGRNAQLLRATHNHELISFLTVLALCHTCRVERADSADVQDNTNSPVSKRKGTKLAERRKNGYTENDSSDVNGKASSYKMNDLYFNGTRNAESDTDTAASNNKLTVGDYKLNTNDNLYEYQASSPDEKAMLIAARNYGVLYHGLVDENVMLISKNSSALTDERPASHTQSSFERYRLLHVLEFDAMRKCMSVIVQDETGEYWLLTKGAESSMFERAASHNDQKQRQIMEHIAEYATRGLRTLVIGRRIISPDEYVTLDRNLRDAQLAITDRESALQAVYRTVEKDLELLGATGIEDRLQDGVGETLKNLRSAGITVWVLTGDKEETAVNIAQSCSLFYDNMRLLRFTQQPDAAGCQHTLRTLLEQTELETNQPDYGLVIDGVSLALALDSSACEYETMKQLLLHLCLKCKSVLCCRVTPLQKAQVVRLVKRGVKGAITCAIGDGANDVSMIQEAHVGLGIFGSEGRQAAQTSDYCFARFRYLSRALLLHGHFFYQRISMLILYYFYKNVVYIFNMFFYQFLCAYSQLPVYDWFTVTVFNIAFTTIPILVFGLFEQHIHRDLLIANPELYKLVRRNATLSIGNFMRWQLLGLYQAAVIAFGSYAFFLFNTESTLPDGKPLDTLCYGTFTTLCIVLTVNIQLMIETRYWNAAIFGSYMITYLVAYFGMALLYEAFIWYSSDLNSYKSYFLLQMVLSYPVLWLLCFAIVAVCILPKLVAKAITDIRSTEGKQRLEKAVRQRLRKELCDDTQQSLNMNQFTILRQA